MIGLIQAAVQTDSVATTVTGLRTDFNALLAKLRTAPSAGRRRSVAAPNRGGPPPCFYRESSRSAVRTKLQAITANRTGTWSP